MTWTGTNIDIIDNDLTNGDNSLFFNTMRWYSDYTRPIEKAADYLYYIDESFFNYVVFHHLIFFLQIFIQ